ncbi:hypothetical protein [uncultured Cellulomonas sp.]|uniref:hypothetical protein n=1 Tax=uncultured Cellulomonas sp. TaxID=189682 RepID=UPI0028EABC2A|nr:hypothetical protein [uncultured Cellulomonas sp.]
MAAKTPTASSPATPAAASSTYLLTVRSAVIWAIALLCGAAAAAVAVWSVHDAHVAVQVLVGLGTGVGGALGAAATLNQLIAPGDP